MYEISGIVSSKMSKKKMRKLIRRLSKLMAIVCIEKYDCPVPSSEEEDHPLKSEASSTVCLVPASSPNAGTAPFPIPQDVTWYRGAVGDRLINVCTGTCDCGAGTKHYVVYVSTHDGRLADRELMLLIVNCLYRDAPNSSWEIRLFDSFTMCVQVTG